MVTVTTIVSPSGLIVPMIVRCGPVSSMSTYNRPFRANAPLARTQDRKPMLLGYARVSTVDQNLALQRDALTEAGCTKIFT
jgi:hypothetical protein